MRTDGQLVGKILSQNGYPMIEEELAADEQIIGVYGTYDSSEISSLGLIVWKPYKR